MTAEAAPEPFHATGLPLHTRTLVVEAFRAAGDRLRVEAAILDLRKCGFVPTGGDLQTAGFIHHMQLGLSVDPATGTIERLATAQPAVAFEAAPATGGDSCRDPAPRLQALVGERLDAGFVRRLAASFGGPLGCSHLLTLAQLVASSVPRFLGAAPALRRLEGGERVAKRMLCLDGFERADGGIDVALQLSEFVMRPFADVTLPLDRLARQHELRIRAQVDADLSRLEALDAVERVRDPDTLAAAAWQRRDAAVVPLVGGPALRGLAGRVREALGTAPEDEPLRAALLNLAPGMIQCLAALSHRLVAHFSGGRSRSAAPPRALSVGGFPDSCYMWRSDGPMVRARFGAGSGEPS
jgi:hypothetical protein